MEVLHQGPPLPRSSGFRPVHPELCEPTKRRSSASRSALPYGDGRCPSPDQPEWDISPSNSIDTSTDNTCNATHSIHIPLPSLSSSSSSSAPRTTVPLRKRPQLNPFVFKFVAVLISVSWLMAGVVVIRSLRDLQQLIFYEKSSRLQLEHLGDSLQEAAYAVAQEQKLVTRYKKTKAVLHHEVRVFQELSDASVIMFPLARDSDKAMVKEWLAHRQFGLQRKVDRLARYLQNASRHAVLEKYGLGPHRVKFIVDLFNTHDVAPTVPPKTSSFVVEMASMDVMPHAVHFFLDLVSAKAWDNTIFIHHENAEHVVAAAPIDYRTRRVKQNRWHELGWAELAFPEYSLHYPHQKYTMGFSGEGPTFYINTVDNTIPHGPGGQGHHLLPTDADPCFGTVVEGRDVIDSMINLALKESRINLDGDHPWANEEHRWTHIISLELEDGSS